MENNLLRKEQDRTLISDLKSVLSYREWINAKTHRNFDSTRILGVVAAGKGAENYLPYTIPKIIEQISEIGMGADIIIGLNNGFECQTVINRFTLLPDVQVIHLYTGEKPANNIPAKIFDNLNCEGEPYHLSNIALQPSQHRIFVVHQKEGPYSAGKIRVLGDIYGSLLLKSIDKGWISPAILVTFDAESQFLVEQEGPVPDPESNGLRLIVSQLQSHPEIDILGTRNKHIVYRKGIANGIEVFFPNYSEQVPPFQWFINIVHGKYKGFKWKPGGGTVGRTDIIISLLAVIIERYPGSRCEDVQLTILAQHAGFRGDIFMDVISTNRTPSPIDKTAGHPPQLAWMEQMYRWIAGVYALERNYGKHNIDSIMLNGFPWNILLDAIGFFKRVMVMDKTNLLTLFLQKSKSLVVAFFALIKIGIKASKQPDILQGSQAKASW